MSLIKIGDWSTEDPGKLDRELTVHEDSVDAELISIRGSYLALPNVVTRISLPAPKPASFALQPGEQTSFDTAMANLSAVLPPLTPANYGRSFTLIKRTGVGTLNVVCQDTAAKLNGIAGFPYVIASAGITVFLCDSAGYYV